MQCSLLTLQPGCTTPCGLINHVCMLPMDRLQPKNLNVDRIYQEILVPQSAASLGMCKLASASAAAIDGVVEI